MCSHSVALFYINKRKSLSDIQWRKNRQFCLLQKTILHEQVTIAIKSHEIYYVWSKIASRHKDSCLFSYFINHEENYVTFYPKCRIFLILYHNKTISHFLFGFMNLWWIHTKIHKNKTKRAPSIEYCNSLDAIFSRFCDYAVDKFYG